MTSASCSCRLKANKLTCSNNFEWSKGPETHTDCNAKRATSRRCQTVTTSLSGHTSQAAPRLSQNARGIVLPIAQPVLVNVSDTWSTTGVRHGQPVGQYSSRWVGWMGPYGLAPKHLGSINGKAHQGEAEERQRRGGEEAEKRQRRGREETMRNSGQNTRAVLCNPNP